MVTLNVIKDALKVDFADWDETLSDLLESSIVFAENVTGVDREDFNQEVKSAIVDDVKAKFTNTESNAIVVFRRNCKRPMF